jgi:hypothetical protein
MCKLFGVKAGSMKPSFAIVIALEQLKKKSGFPLPN